MTDRSASASAPIADGELDDLLAPLTSFESLVLAVSGGPDSMALMHLVARWLARGRDRRPRVLVVTVDHGLRPESAREAGWVAKEAGKLGLAHETLGWQGEKPRSGIQEAAREARYRLLSDRSMRLAEGRRGAVVTAHHRDDQAETFLMRLARGSGLDGLSAMRPARAMRREGGAQIVRPLLGVARSRLTATLAACGAGWIEDPSNEREEFERVRIRGALAGIERLGITAGRIAESVGRLQRAREVLEAAAGEFEQAVGLDINFGAYACFDRESFLAGPMELRVRLTARLLEAFGGQAEPPRLAKIESLAARMEQASWRGSTLGGCVVARHKAEIRVVREPGRRGLPEIRLAPGERAVWDLRFRVWLSPREDRPVVVRALGARAYAGLAKGGRGDGGLPAKVAATLPAFFRDGALMAVPQLPFGPEASKAAGDRAACSAEFIW